MGKKPPPAPTRPHTPIATSEARLKRMVRRAWAMRWRRPELSKRHAETAYEATKAAGARNLTHLTGQAARVLGWHARWRGDFRSAWDFFSEAEDLLRTSEDKSPRIEAMAGRAVGLYSQGKQDEASELIRRALADLGSAGAIQTRVDLFLVQGTIVSYSGAFSDALAIVDEAITLARSAAARSELCHAVHIRARILMRKGDPANAMAPAQEAVELATSSRVTVLLPYALEILAAVQLAEGEPGLAAETAEKAIALGEKRDDRRVVCQALEILGKAQRKLGQNEEALRTQKRGLAIATDIAYPLWQRWFQLEIAGVLETQGKYSAALTAYKAYSELDQKLFRMETETRMAEMRTKFDLLRAQELAEVERARASDLATAQEIAEHAARTDGLTKIANRVGLEHYLETANLSADESGYAFVVVDLDSFKPVNDTFGHMVGDAVLVEISARLSNVIRKSDLVARLGGDEFGLIVRQIDTPAEATDLGERLRTVFADPVACDDRQIDVAASIGIALHKVGDQSFDKLMSAADQAMYAAKSSTRTSYQLYDPKELGEAPNLNTMDILRQAIRNGEIQPWYQPQIDLRTGRIAGFEALARWVKPDGSIAPPSTFLPQIEQYNLQGEFTFAMTRNALSQIRKWDDLDVPTPSISINMVEEVLASRDACDDIVSMLHEDTSLLKNVTFEITEDVFLDRSVEAIRDSIQMLSKKGVRFSMDDFGTGYGSFLHLRQLDVHELKIDIAFVRGIGKDRSAEVIIEGFIAIARGLGLAVAGEGIETTEQLQFLTSRGCDIGQGFLFGAALAPQHATAFLTDWHDQQRRSLA